MGDRNAITCPACGSCRHEAPPVAQPEAVVCLDCATLFVPEVRRNPALQLCDDCAFRPDSPERLDPWKWTEIIQTTIVDGVHPFYCHKGVTCELRGTTLHYVQPAAGRSAMTPCAGWRAHKLAYESGVPARLL